MNGVFAYICCSRSAALSSVIDSMLLFWSCSIVVLLFPLVLVPLSLGHSLVPTLALELPRVLHDASRLCRIAREHAAFIPALLIQVFLYDRSKPATCEFPFRITSRLSLPNHFQLLSKHPLPTPSNHATLRPRLSFPATLRNIRRPTSLSRHRPHSTITPHLFGKIACGRSSRGREMLEGVL